MILPISLMNDQVSQDVKNEQLLFCLWVASLWVASQKLVFKTFFDISVQ